MTVAATFFIPKNSYSSSSAPLDSPSSTTYLPHKKKIQSSRHEEILHEKVLSARALAFNNPNLAVPASTVGETQDGGEVSSVDEESRSCRDWKTFSRPRTGSNQMAKGSCTHRNTDKRRSAAKSVREAAGNSTKWASNWSVDRGIFPRGTWSGAKVCWRWARIPNRNGGTALSPP